MHAVAEHAVLRVTPEGLVPLFVSAGTFGVLGQEPWRRVLVGNREARTLIVLVLAIVYRTTCVTRAQYYVLGPETVRHARIHVTILPDRAVSAWPILYITYEPLHTEITGRARVWQCSCGLDPAPQLTASALCSVPYSDTALAPRLALVLFSQACSYVSRIRRIDVAAHPFLCTAVSPRSYGIGRLSPSRAAIRRGPERHNSAFSGTSVRK